jgi:protein tyrosine phosphatase (PTP) superfamily phosphohydrolase (DUF442 family)
MIATPRFPAMITCLGLLLAATHALAEEKKTDPKVKKPLKLEACELGSTNNVHRLGKIYLAGQPSAADFATAKKNDGIKTVINLRTPGEMRFDEKGVLKGLNIEYHYLPFGAPETLKDEIFEKSLKVLGDKKKQPVLMHCASANRVGAIWLVHRVLTDKIAYDKALKEAKEVGLRFPPYEAIAKRYIEKAQAKAEAKARTKPPTK